MKDNRSAVWGGATIGLVVGLILGFFVGDFWMTVLYSVVIGAALGVVANILGWLSDRGRKRAATPPGMGALPDWSAIQLPNAEGVLREHSPGDFATTPNAAAECVEAVRLLVDEGWWRAGYDSPDSFYAAHEEQHPDIRVYAEVSREIPMADALEPPDGIGEVIVQRIAAHHS